MILIVTFPENDHVKRVVGHLTRPHVQVNVGAYPAQTRLSAGLGPDWMRMHFTLSDGQRVSLEEVGAVWYRRVRPYTLHQDLFDETARTFAWSESNEALLGVWQALDCYWMNPYSAEETAQRKILQLAVARQVKLSIPETLITSDPDLARSFLELHGPDNVIRKAFRNIAQAPRQTSRVGESGVALIEAVKYAPVTFQRYVPADLDLRVTIVGEEVFAASIRSQPEYQTDYRSGLGSATVAPYDLPETVASSLLALMKRLDLKYGAIDMRVTPDGEHVFLEVNPAGEYLFISDRTELPIPAAIAATLEREDRQRHP